MQCHVLEHNTTFWRNEDLSVADRVTILFDHSLPTRY